MRFGYRLLGLVSGVSVFTALLFGPAMTFAGDDVVTEGMTITAEKREKPVREVAGAVQVMTGEALQDHGIEDVHDVVSLIPNVTLRKNSCENILVIRGLSSYAGSLHSTAGFYVDDVNYPIHFMQNPDLYDIERLEILKGPQGTLYGRNAASGVVHIRTRQPGETPAATARVESGIWDVHDGVPFHSVEGSVSGPVAGTGVRAGISGHWEASDGPAENQYRNDRGASVDHLNGRMVLAGNPSDRMAVSLISEGFRHRDGMAVYRYEDGEHATTDHTYAWDGANRKDSYGNTQALRIRYHLKNADLIAVTSRHDFHLDFINDADLSSAPWGSSDQMYKDTVVGQEIRLASRDDGRRLEWLTGIYGFREDLDTDFAAWGTVHANRQEIRGAALFGQTTWHVADHLRLTAGLRLDHTDMSATKTITGSGDPIAIGSGADQDFTELLPRFGVSWDATAHHTVYASAARGYLAGGYDGFFATDEEKFAFDPETTWNYEIGVKSGFLDGRLHAQLTGFYVAVTDKQVAQWDPETGNPEARRIVNAAEAVSMGGEGMVSLQVIPGLMLTAGLGYTDATFSDWVEKDKGVVAFDYDGKRLPGAPEWTGSLGAVWRTAGGWMAAGDVVTTSDYYTDPKNQEEVDGYTVVNLRTGYETERFDLVLFCDNLFNKGYAENRWQWLGSLIQEGAPRKIGITVTVRF